MKFFSILFSKRNFKFSVSSNFIVVSACSSLSTSFRISMSGPRIDDGCDALFFIATLRSCDDRAIIKISFNFETLWSCVLVMLFLVKFHHLLRVVLLSRWGVYGFGYIRFFGDVYFFRVERF